MWLDSLQQEWYFSHTPLQPQWDDCFEFGVRGDIADIIIQDKFYENRFRGFGDLTHQMIWGVRSAAPCHAALPYFAVIRTATIKVHLHQTRCRAVPKVCYLSGSRSPQNSNITIRYYTGYCSRTSAKGQRSRSQGYEVCCNAWRCDCSIDFYS